MQEKSLLQPSSQGCRKSFGPSGDRMLRAQELALVDPLSHLIALPSEPLVRPPSVPGPKRAWQPTPSIASRGLQSRVLQSRTPRLPPCRECVKYWMVLPAHRCLGVHLYGGLYLSQVYVCVCVPPVWVCAVCTGSVCVGLSTSVGIRAHGLFVCWYMCICLFPSCMHWYYLCPCVCLCTCGCLVICA